jgi:hypothetical protein
VNSELTITVAVAASGEELQCGRHGYSARDYGFRFDIDMDSGSDDGKGNGSKMGPVDGEDTPPPIHPHAGDPLLVEDPGAVLCCAACVAV